MKKLLLSVITIFLTACSIDPLDVYNPNGHSEVLKNTAGESVSDCTGRGRALRQGDDANQFWKENNLPKGTTDFVCVDGKAYLPSKQSK